MTVRKMILATLLMLLYQGLSAQATLSRTHSMTDLPDYWDLGSKMSRI